MRIFEKFLKKQIVTNNNFSISTYIDRLNHYLKIWIKFFSKYKLDIYIFYDQLEINLIKSYLKNINIKNIKFISMSNKKILKNKALFNQFLNDTKNKFLTFYKKHIHVDIDELLVCDNLDYVLENTDLDFIVTNGFEIIENFNVEKQYEEKILLMNQRSYGVFLAETETRSPYDKVCVFSNKIKNSYKIQSNGRHATTEKSNNLINLVHLGRFDINLMLENSHITNKIYNTNNFWNDFKEIKDVKNYLNEYFIKKLVKIPKNIKDNIHV